MQKLKQPTDWGCPIQIEEKKDNTKSLLITPSRVCGFLLDLMRLKFSNPDNIYHERLRVYTYDSDEFKTHIKIEPGFDYLDTDNLTDLQPGIIVNVAETSVQDSLNGSSQSTLGMSDGFFNSVNDIAYYGGAVLLQAVSPSPLESLLLAEDIFLWLLLFKYNIQDDLKLSNFSVKLLKGPEKPETRGKTCYVSSVQIEWAASFGFTTNRDVPLFSEGTNMV